MALVETLTRYLTVLAEAWPRASLATPVAAALLFQGRGSRDGSCPPAQGAWSYACVRGPELLAALRGIGVKRLKSQSPQALASAGRRPASHPLPSGEGRGEGLLFSELES